MCARGRNEEGLETGAEKAAGLRSESASCGREGSFLSSRPPSMAECEQLGMKPMREVGRLKCGS